MTLIYGNCEHVSENYVSLKVKSFFLLPCAQNGEGSKLARTAVKDIAVYKYEWKVKDNYMSRH
jgi:hypothetical protein